ncbi:FAM76B family protein [Megaselia abdita]
MNVKCNYCRTEFQASKGTTNTVCQKCEQSVKKYGKPNACECCSVPAAFIGTKCQRCAHSEQKYGPAVPCDQCKQRCAFDRRDENKKVNGKLLCYLCTASYKRALAKAQGLEKDGLRKKRPHEKSYKESSTAKKQHTQQQAATTVPPPVASKPDVKQSNSGNSSGSGNGGGGGMSNFTAMMATPMVDPNSSDHVVAMTQLKEKLVSLGKKLTQKDKELLDKEKLITELKSKNFENEIELRNKLRDTDRLNDIKVDLLNKKIASLIKEVAALKKSNKKNGIGSSKVAKEEKDKDSSSAKDSGGSGTDSPVTN